MLDLRKLKLSIIAHPDERSVVRPVRKDDPEEIKRLWEIEKDDLVARFVEDLADDDDEMGDFLSSDRDYLVVAVEGKAGHVDEVEVGKLQGWICIYKEEKRRLSRLSSLGLIEEAGLNHRILEIGFARHPKAKSGQMASAIRQLLSWLFEEHKRAEVPLLVTAYTDPSNEASVRVLLSAGFSKQGTVKYHLKNSVEDHFFVHRGS